MVEVVGGGPSHQADGGGPASGGGNAGSGAPKGDVVDAEYEVKKD